jgi:hypothetical protein
MKKRYELTLKNNYLQILEYQMPVGSDRWEFVRNMDLAFLYTLFYTTTTTVDGETVIDGLRLICPQTNVRYSMVAFTRVSTESGIELAPSSFIMDGADVSFDMVVDLLTIRTGGHGN